MKRVSRAMAAIAAFLGINVVFSFYAPLKFNPFNYPYKGWSWWGFHDLKEDKQVHNVTLLGSSLMVAAINNCDANYLNRPLNLTKHHQSLYLNDKLEETFKGKFRTFNLSAPGQMPSDAYLTVKSLLAASHRPDVIIYGVAPRDFIDSQLGNPTDTEPYHFLSRIVSTDECAGGLFRDPLGRLSWFIDRNLYFAHHALDWQMTAEKAATRLLNKVAAVPSGAQPYTFWQRTKLIPNYRAGEIHPDAVYTHPLKKEDVAANFKDNTEEYKERYKKADDHTFKTQMYFLGKLGTLCKKERIELIVVNMPVSRENINQLGATTYLDYVFAVKGKAFAYGAPFFDLNYFYLYDKSLYHDYVHLNAFGGAKFLDSLVSALNEDPRTKLTMEMAGRELWKHDELERLAKGIDRDRDPDSLTSLEKLKGKLAEHKLIEAKDLVREHRSKIRNVVNELRNKKQIGSRIDTIEKAEPDDETGVAM